MYNILVAGVYLADRENSAAHIMSEFARTSRHRVEQRWIAISETGIREDLLPHTTRVVRTSTPKFRLLDELVENIGSFDFVFLSDDDIELDARFLDNFIAASQRMDLALSQPARTADSYIDHYFVMRMPGIMGRVTRFVEIGPVVCVRSDAYPAIFPFGNVGMGWGLDFIWPKLIQQSGLRMGIVDAFPVAHRLRKPLAYYLHSEANKEMQNLLAKRSHLSRAEAFIVQEIYS
jgi:hypothetical protein